MSRTIDVGSRIADYEIISVLGKGGAGSVYTARHVETGNEVALKVLHPDHEMAEEVERRFVREISVAQNIDSPYAVKYFDCGLGEDGVLYYTMERVEWGSLKDVLKARGTLPWKDAVECAVQIARGLDALHSQNVIHRDLKPENIFLSDDGRLKLGDFGLVRAVDMSRLTLDGTTVGTAKYLAPEQARGQEVDARTDLYALGCNLFELLAGRPPFIGSASSLGYVELMKQHVEVTAPSVTDFAPSCPPALAGLVATLLEKDLDARPDSACEVVDDLEQILSHATEGDGESGQDNEESDQESLTERLRAEGLVPSQEVDVKALGIAAAILCVVIVGYVLLTRN